jgi:hypothetical protein
MARSVLPRLLPIVLTSTAVLSGQSASPFSDVPDFLRREIGLDAGDLAALERGEPVTKALDTHEKREIALFAAVRLGAPRRQFVDAYRDIERFKHGSAVLAIGRFGTPPQPTDLAALTTEDEEIADLKKCRPGDCAFKLALSRIDEIQRFDWTAPDARTRMDDLIRLRLAEYVRSYQEQGAAALAVYADRRYRTTVSEEHQAVLRASPLMLRYTPELQRYLAAYPDATLPFSDTFFYWAREKFGLKPTVSLYHVVVADDPQQPDRTVIASKQVYASHYFEAGLELYTLVDHPSGSGTYLLYVGRSRADALRGTFGGLKKAIVQGRALDGLKRAMASIRARFN